MPRKARSSLPHDSVIHFGTFERAHRKWRAEMKRNLPFCLLIGLALAVILGVFLGVRARTLPQNEAGKAGTASAHRPAAASKPLRLAGGILVPGNPIRFDISWVDQARGRYYLAESGNAAVDVFDAENDLFIGRIGGFHGIPAADDPCGRIEGMGPNGVMVTPDNHLWADDAGGTVKVFDLSIATA